MEPVFIILLALEKTSHNFQRWPCNLQDVYQEFYNSKEVGRRLAESLCAHYGGLPAKNGPEEMPKLGMARVVGTDLPGGGSIIYVGTPAAMAHPSLEPSVDGRKILTKNENGFTQIVFDENNVVQSLTYAGFRPVNGTKYQARPRRRLSFLVAQPYARPGVHWRCPTSLAPCLPHGVASNAIHPTNNSSRRIRFPCV